MKKLMIVCILGMLAACGTTATSNAMIDPSLVASPDCQPKFGLPGCYSGGGGE